MTKQIIRLKDQHLIWCKFHFLLRLNFLSFIFVNIFVLFLVNETQEKLKNNNFLNFQLKHFFSSIGFFNSRRKQRDSEVT